MKPKPVFKTIKTILGRGFAAKLLPRFLFVYHFAWADEDGKFARIVIVSSFHIRSCKASIIY